MQNRLKMNDDKTEFIIFRGRQAMQKCNTNAIRVGDTNVYSSPCVKLMGMTWDRYISFTSHIPVKSNAASFALSNLNKIRMHLSKENALKLATALVFLHMDYCNSMFVGPQKETLKPYQRYQRQVLLTRVWRIECGEMSVGHDETTVWRNDWQPSSVRVWNLYNFLSDKRVKVGLTLCWVLWQVLSAFISWLFNRSLCVYRYHFRYV